VDKRDTKDEPVKTGASSPDLESRLAALDNRSHASSAPLESTEGDLDGIYEDDEVGSSPVNSRTSRLPILH
jgi:hypothetical protein